MVLHATSKKVPGVYILESKPNIMGKKSSICPQKTQNPQKLIYVKINPLKNSSIEDRCFISLLLNLIRNKIIQNLEQKQK